MYILIIIASLVTTFLVIIQNPKGGGLTSSISGVSQVSSFLGTRRAAEGVVTWTWYAAGVMVGLALLSNIFVGSSSTASKGELRSTSAIKSYAPAPAALPPSVEQLQRQSADEAPAEEAE